MGTTIHLSLKKYCAFTLVELMVVIVIIGILSAVAIPTYSAYVKRAKIAEATTGVDKMSKDQTMYYLSHKKFRYVTPNPSFTVAYQGGGFNGNLMSSKDGSQYTSGFEDVGYPFAAGSSVQFVYHVYSGRTDSAGNDITNFCPGAGCDFAPISDNISAHGWRSNLSACDNTRYMYDDFMRIRGTPNFSWAILQASRDFKTDTPECTLAFKLLGTNTNGKVVSSPLQILNPGE